MVWSKNQAAVQVAVSSQGWFSSPYFHLLMTMTDFSDPANRCDVPAGTSARRLPSCHPPCCGHPHAHASIVDRLLSYQARQWL